MSFGCLGGCSKLVKIMIFEQGRVLKIAFSCVGVFQAGRKYDL